ncbi:MAG: ligase-associated DNA damage response DEXH box helicase [Phototrophicaceae bacterium]
MKSKLAPIEAWFLQNEWTIFPFQRKVWKQYLKGESGLVHSPTGTGKTYAAWMGALAEWLASENSHWKATKQRPHPPIQVLWITPLRALAHDTANNLRKPLVNLNVPWSVETRTGDTKSSMRQRQRRRLPTTLITTPESLSLMLTWTNSKELLSTLKLVVVDEWHELLASKRGTQTELGLARLRYWYPALKTWGLSATMGNLDVALQSLLGYADYQTGEVSQGQLVEANIKKKIQIKSVIPATMERFPWAGHLGLKLLTQVVDIIKQNRTTLIFCNTRNQVERWYQAILEAEPDLAGEIALHHGSISRESRNWVEQALRDKQLKCVVCTSSLDLGVDFPEVDAVLQVSSPKGVARLIQRAGRSGHQPNLKSTVICVPAHALELLEISATRQAMLSNEIEARPPLDKPLDVLLQHLVTIGVGSGFVSENLYQEVRTSYSYRNLTELEWQWAIDFLTSGGDALKAYDDYHRLHFDGTNYRVVNKNVIRLHRMSIGTIIGDTSLQVQYMKGQKVGQVEESFISRLKPGDKFTLGGKVLEFVRLRDLKVLVKRAKGYKGVVPRWYGGKMPLSQTLTQYMRHQLDQVSQKIYHDDELKALIPIFDTQRKLSRIPSDNELLIERLKSRDGHHIFVYPFAGRLVHEGLAALIAYRLAQYQAITFTISSNDYGFELLSPDLAPLEQALNEGLLSVENLDNDIIASLNASEMARRQFREIARVSGLTFSRYPGGQKTMRQLQTSASLIFDVLTNYDSDNLLLKQAQREVLLGQLEEKRLTNTLQRLSQSQVVVKEVERATPFAFPLLIDRLRQTVSSEKLDERIARMVRQLEKAVSI